MEIIFSWICLWIFIVLDFASKFPDIEDEVYKEEDSSADGESPEGKASWRVTGLAAWGMVSDSQRTMSDHQHGANENSHQLENVGHMLSDDGRDCEHQEYHQEEYTASK